MENHKSLNRKSSLPSQLGSLILLIVFILIIWYALPHRQHPAGSLRFFSDDDGTTWFADDGKKLPPFEHNGKEAVIARVYQQSKDNKPFVAYLEKYSDEAKKKLTANHDKQPQKPGMVAAKETPMKTTGGLLVKKPHQGEWVPEDDAAGKAVRSFTAPDGTRDYLPMTPE